MKRLSTFFIAIVILITSVFLFTACKKETYTVAFDTMGAGKTIKPTTAEDGSAVDAPQDPVREGYAFLGWYLGDELWDFDRAVTENIILKAKWAPATYTITFEGADFDPIEVTYGEKFTLPVAEKEKHTFLGWYNGSYKINDGEWKIGSDVTLTAKWELEATAGLTYVYSETSKTYTVTGYEGTDALVRIPSVYNGMPVSSIGVSAFAQNKTITTVIVSEGVLNIGTSAFKECTALTEVTLPESITVIPRWAFYDCLSLSSIKLSSSTANIGGYAFWGCDNLDEIYLPLTLKSIGQYAFFKEGAEAMTAIYYGGTEADRAVIDIDSKNDMLTNGVWYYYSETEPAVSGSFWHYDEYKTIIKW